MSSLEQNSNEGTWFLSQIAAVYHSVAFKYFEINFTNPSRRQYILDAYNMSLGIAKSTKLIENKINWLLWLVWVLFNTWWGYQKRVTRTKEINYAETSVIQLLWYQNSSGYAKFRINQMPQAFLQGNLQETRLKHY